MLSCHIGGLSINRHFDQKSAKHIERTTMQSNSGLPSFVQKQQQQHQQATNHGMATLSMSAGSKPLTKSMSGVSLAMMQSDEHIDDGNNNNATTTTNKDPKEESTAEK
jgi:hypothetical protein